MKTLKVVRQVSETVVEITRADLIERLDLPTDARLYASVPGGGDWSNMDLTIGEDSHLFARWRTETETEETA